MAARKPQIRKPVAKKPVAKKPVAKKPAAKKAATRALTRAESIAMGKGSSAKSRKDFAGTTGFGDTTQSFFDSKDGRKAMKSAENYLKSKGVNPNSYTSNKGGNKGQSPKWDMYNAGNPSMSSPLSKAYWKDFSGGGKVVNGIPRFQKDGVAKDAYKRVTAEVKLKSSKPPKKKKK